MGTPFRKVKSEIRELLALQSNIAAVLDPLIKIGFSDFSPDIGRFNEYAVAPPQAPEVYEDGMPITLKPANTNTGPSTLSVNGMPRKPIVNADGTPLAGGEIQKDGIATVRFDGVGFRLISSAAGPFLLLAGGTMLGQILGLQTGVDGLDIDPGSDIDADLLTVGVTAAPKLSWVEASDLFNLSKALKTLFLELTADPSGTPAANTLYKENIPKAWIDLDGTGTIAINASFNVSSINDDGTGLYTITWDNDFPGTNYVIAGHCEAIVGVGSTMDTAAAGKAAGSVSIRVLRIDNGTLIDTDDASLVAFGDQA